MPLQVRLLLADSGKINEILACALPKFAKSLLSKARGSLGHKP